MIAQYEAGGTRTRVTAALRAGSAHSTSRNATHTGLTTPRCSCPSRDFYKGLAVTVPLHLATLRADDA